MADELEKLKERLTKLEEKKGSAELFIGSLLSPLLTAVIGAVTLIYVERAKSEAETTAEAQEAMIQARLDETTKSIERLELAQKMVPDLFFGELRPSICHRAHLGARSGRRARGRNPSNGREVLWQEAR